MKINKFLRILLTALCLAVLTLSFAACVGTDESAVGSDIQNSTDGANGTGSQGGSGTGTESGDGNEGAGTEEHVHAFGEWETLLEPTCTEEGKNQENALAE